MYELIQRKGGRVEPAGGSTCGNRRAHPVLVAVTEVGALWPPVRRRLDEDSATAWSKTSHWRSLASSRCRSIRIGGDAAGSSTVSSANLIYQLRVMLVGVEPPVWRVVQIAGNVTLYRLHLIPQAALGWTNSHRYKGMRWLGLWVRLRLRRRLPSPPLPRSP